MTTVATAIAVDPGTIVERSMMGGRVAVAIRDDDEVPGRLEHAAGMVLDRLEAWAARLTRFDPASELCRLNDDERPSVRIGPTLAELLDWARMAEGMTDGLVDVAMLDARLAAEVGEAPSLRDGAAIGARRRWSLTRLRRGAIVHREPGVRFDLDGIAKGWLADRALAISPGRSAMVDGDGDIAIRLAPGDSWSFGIADPIVAGGQIAAVTVAAPMGWEAGWGIATSGTSVHRWTHAFGVTHHLIDPRTRRPALTDVVQATVLADTARAAEALAKIAVVAGSEHAFDRLDRPDVHGLLLVTDRGELRASREMTRWLA